MKAVKAVNNLRARASTSKSPGLLNSESTISNTASNGNGNGGTTDNHLSSSHEPVQVEPKTYFANERTFIQWISAALLLLTVSSIMMGSGSYNGTSSVIAFSSLVLVCYASYVYFRRVKLLRSGTAHGYLDFLGPSILAIGVGLGVAIVFADAIKGSEFLPWGSSNGGNYKNRRFLKTTAMSNPGVPPMMPLPQVMEMEQKMVKKIVPNTLKMMEVDGKCSRHSLQGINQLEYQPRDIVLSKDNNKLYVATPQSLVSHPLFHQDHQVNNAVLATFPDTDIQSMVMVGDSLYAISTGPYKTELIEISNSASTSEIGNRFLIHGSPSSTASMVCIPSSSTSDDDEGKLHIYIDGTMHIYHLPSDSNMDSQAAFSRTGSINMKVLNSNNAKDNDPIAAMEHFEGLTYVLREQRNVMEVWDFSTATLVDEMTLPFVSSSDKWVGMAFERRVDDKEDETHALRKSSSMVATTSSVYLHMPLDAFPPQLWSFRLDERTSKSMKSSSILSFPDC